jgi:hypothetical protein
VIAAFQLTIPGWVGGFLGFFAIAMIAGFVSRVIGHAPSRALHRRFATYGPVEGRTKAEIIAAVGPPTSMSELPEGRTLAHWHAPGYDIALGFMPDEVCYGIELDIAAGWFYVQRRMPQVRAVEGMAHDF